MSRFGTRRDVADKVDWEGGVDEALAYGVAADEMPDPELEAAWAAAKAAYEPYAKAAAVVEGLLEDADDDEGDE